MRSLAVFLIVVALAAFTGAMFTPGEWYEALSKPAWTPPNWLFPLVWSVLYVAIAVAGWRVWRVRPGASKALLWWIAQLLLNTAWSWLFFGLHCIGCGLVDIGLLLAAVGAFIVAARQVDRLAAWLFVPYALWLAYAASLNLYIWRFN